MTGRARSAGAAFLAIACAITGGATADVVVPDTSARAVLPGCRALVEARGAISSPGMAFCNGTVDALRYVGELLPEDYCYAVPISLPQHEVVATIVREIDAVYPTVERQLFKGLVVEIFHFHWPCRPRG